MILQIAHAIKYNVEFGEIIISARGKAPSEALFSKFVIIRYSASIE